MSFEARDTRADGGTRHVEIARDRVVLRRSVRGVRMAINIRISEFLGVALRRIDGAPTLILKHRDPSLSVPLGDCSDGPIEAIWEEWSDTLALPRLDEAQQQVEPAPRRRRRNAVRARRPSILMRRRVGRDFAGMDVYQGEREIIAPE